MASGYNIPISLSAASTTTSSLSQDVSTTFNFTSPGASGAKGDVVSNPIAPATAVSSASNEGKAQSSAQGTGVGSGTTMTAPSVSFWTSPAFWGIVSLSAVVFIYYKTKP